jgi:hypothetical protein
VGQIGAVKVDIVETGAVDVPTALLALAAFADLSASTRSGRVYVVLGCGLVGVALQLTVV